MQNRKNTTTLTATENPFLRYAKIYIRNMPRQRKIVFFLKYIKYSLKNRDYEAAEEGLYQLCMIIPELKNDLRIACRTYLSNDEGERITMLFKHAFGKIRSAAKANQRSGQKGGKNPVFLFS